jgi:hypothetical protein
MKRVLAVAVVLSCSVFAGALTSQKANTLMKLVWKLNPPEEAVAAYRVNVTSFTTNASVTVVQPPLELTNVLGDLPNGEYTIVVSAIGESGLESEPSEPLVVFWYGNKPSAPERPVVLFAR